jgi:Regulator of G protein signaling domain
LYSTDKSSETCLFLDDDAVPAVRPRAATTAKQLQGDLNLAINEGTKDKPTLAENHWWSWTFDSQKRANKTSPDEYLEKLKKERKQVQDLLILVRNELFKLMEQDTFPRFQRQQKEKYIEMGKTYKRKTLLEVLGNPKTRNKFWDFCESEHNVENLKCYTHLATIETVDDFDFWRLAKLTYENHLRPRARELVNISSLLTNAMKTLSGLIHVEEAAACAEREFGPSGSSAQKSPKVTKKGK